MGWVRVVHSTIREPAEFVTFGREHTFRHTPDPVYRVDVEFEMDYEALQSFLAYMREEHGVDIRGGASNPALPGRPELPPAHQPPELPGPVVIDGILEDDDEK